MKITKPKSRTIRFNENEYQAMLTELGGNVAEQMKCAGRGGGAIIFVRPVYDKRRRALSYATMYFKNEDANLTKAVEDTMSDRDNWNRIALFLD